MEGLHILSLCITVSFSLLTNSAAVSIIAVNQTIRDGDTIVSAGEIFELGFFSPGTSKYRYLGIWYRKVSPGTVVWVANRETPLTDMSGGLRFGSEGALLLLTGGNTIIWSSNSSVSVRSINPVAQLLDTGNFVIKDNIDSGEENFIWQSFDYPGNTYLPGMKMGKDFMTGRESYLTSWRGTDDPSPGEYTLRWVMIKDKYPQVYKMKGSTVETRIGPWNGVRYVGLPSYTQNSYYTFKMEVVINQKEAYFKYSFNSTTFFDRIILTYDGGFKYCHLGSPSKDWIVGWTIPLDQCDHYGMCGAYGSCDTVTSPCCGCLKGFEPTDEWRPDNATSGCQRRIALDCAPAEGFHKFPGVKLPDTQDAWFNELMTLSECEMACKNNCSCTAYANPNITRRGSGCLLWFGDLNDVRVYPQNGQDLYVRMAASELLELQSGFGRKKRVVIGVLSTAALVAGLGMIFALYDWNKRKKRSDVEREGSLIKLLDNDQSGSIEMGDVELPFFSLSKVAKATNNFSIANKLGEGGFGPVYQGMLEGKEIAVKRLSKSSRQGFDEFKNEIICIAKLQHRNLVKLLGYCTQADEIMLVYEHMPNKSLDQFIFDDSKKSLLDWPQRFHIIHGIARGLLYLHQDSRLRIIHRDLKAGNVLLDFDMNPKISDFGLARMFDGNESEAKTKKVIGTLGYISPEYAVNGLFSVKSDVFSFGVLVLEIVSGKKNSGFSHEDHHDSLLGHAWRLYKEGNSLDLLDASLGDSCNESEVLRSINIGLLCVQQRAEDRPSMSSVVIMFGGDSSLPPPKQPGFFVEQSVSPTTSLSTSSINEVTVTQTTGR